MRNDTSVNKQMREAVRTELPVLVPQLIYEMFPRAARGRYEVRAGDITGSPGSSFSLNTQGPKIGLWLDHSTDEGGDVFSLVMERFGFTFSEALRWLGKCAGFSCDALEAVNWIRR
jgi:hypothetical protein